MKCIICKTKISFKVWWKKRLCNKCMKKSLLKAIAFGLTNTFIDYIDNEGLLEH